MALEIQNGEKYFLGLYKAGGRKVEVTVTSIDLEDNSWFDDHQGGGMWVKGTVNYLTSDGYVGWESLQYAQENWKLEFSEDDMDSQFGMWNWHPEEQFEE